MVAVSLIRLVGDYLFRQQVRDDQQVARSIAASLDDDFYAKNANSLLAGAIEYSEDDVSRVLVLDSLGVVQADSESVLNGTRFVNSEAAEVLNGAESAGNIYEDSTADETFFKYLSASKMIGVYAARLDSGGAVVYVSESQEIYNGLHGIRLKIIGWMLLATVLAVAVSMLIVRSISRPIDELSEGIGRMTRGDLSARVRVKGKNEFSRLALAFNTMSERIEQLDKTRSSFVSNASHELKTPLSTMKILIETLIYQDNPDPALEREFLGDINKEIDRLNSIVTDLLTLANIDNGGDRLKIENLRLGQLIQEQTRRLMPLARENGIEMDLVIKDQCETTGDVSKLQQVFYNVIDNAIKYTPRGGSVLVELARSGKTAIAKVTDTGIGIPQEDLPHIFDRFYRVDKARSRATGGTGLGLSIVKQIVVLHGGEITAAPGDGKGTVFTISLPIQ